jgi:hypothetical protein
MTTRIFSTFLLLGAAASAAEIWTFDRTDKLGGHSTTVLGKPKVIKSPVGKAVEFDGKQDALFVDVHPLAGAETFTWEVIFRPDADGAPAQRFFHLAVWDPKTKVDTEARLLFEIRVGDGKWYLDSFANAGPGKASKALMDKTRQFPAGEWYAVEQVYDGKQYRNYVNGVQVGFADVHLEPQGPGHSSAGVRINKVDYFKGAIRMARFTKHALTPDEFLTVPKP